MLANKFLAKIAAALQVMISLTRNKQILSKVILGQLRVQITSSDKNMRNESLLKDGLNK